MRSSFCQAISSVTKKRCAAPPLKSKGKRFCFYHDPESKEHLKEISTKGGRAPKKMVVSLKDFVCRDSRDVRKWLAAYITKAGRGEISVPPKEAHHLARAFMESEKNTLVSDITSIKKHLGMGEKIK